MDRNRHPHMNCSPVACEMCAFKTRGRKRDPSIHGSYVSSEELTRRDPLRPLNNFQHTCSPRNTVFILDFAPHSFPSSFSTVFLLSFPSDKTFSTSGWRPPQTTALMSTPQGSLRQRGAKDSKKRPTTPIGDAISSQVEQTWEQAKHDVKETAKQDWDHRIAFTIITFLGFLTRFWGISHPNQVVFDEVHFGKVRRG